MKNTVSMMNALLPLERQIVGVKLVYSKEEFESYEAKEVTGFMNYCVAVKSATLGHSVKFTAAHSACGGSTRALGLAKPNEDYYNGNGGKNLGLYCNVDVSAGVSQKMKICLKETYGVVVKPLECMKKEPDVVLVVANTFTCMRVIQGYTYFFGLKESFCMTGNQAVCVEGTTVPLLTQDINVSVFCSGTRFLAGWKDTEMVVGIPYAKFEKTVEGIRCTANAVETDTRKKELTEKLELLGEETADIKAGEAYFIKLEEEKKRLRAK